MLALHDLRPVLHMTKQDAGTGRTKPWLITRGEASCFYLIVAVPH